MERLRYLLSRETLVKNILLLFWGFITITSGVTELLDNVDVEVGVQSYRVNVKGKFGLCSF